MASADWPLSLCEAYLSGVCSVGVLRLLQAAADDPDFAREVGSAVRCSPALAFGAELGLGYDGSASRAFADRVRRGWVPSEEAAVPLLASVLWFSRRPMTLVFGASSDAGLLLLRAGRRVLERVEFRGGACHIPDPSVLSALRGCERLRSVIGLNVSSVYPEDLAAAVKEHAPASLRHMTLDFSAPLMGQLVIPWTVGLASSLRSLTLRSAGLYFRTGLADCIARSCPALTSLSLNLDDAAANLWCEEQGAAALARLLAALPGLRSLTLSDALLSAAGGRALASLSELERLELRDVCAESGALHGICLPRLTSLSVQSSLYQEGMRELGELLLGVRRIAVLRIAMPPHSVDVAPLLPSLTACIAASALREFSFEAYLLRGPTAVGVVRAAAGAARTLRTLSLMGLWFRTQEQMRAATGYLSACRSLRRLTFDAVSHPTGCPMDEQLRELISAVGSVAPRLESIRTNCIGYPVVADEASSVAARAFPRTLLAARELEERRRAEAEMASAWAVVRSGIERHQERRLRGGKSSDASLISRLPASVLRQLGVYVRETPTPLRIG